MQDCLFARVPGPAWRAQLTFRVAPAVGLCVWCLGTKGKILLAAAENLDSSGSSTSCTLIVLVPRFTPCWGTQSYSTVTHPHCKIFFQVAEFTQAWWGMGDEHVCSLLFETVGIGLLKTWDLSWTSFTRSGSCNLLNLPFISLRVRMKYTRATYFGLYRNENKKLMNIIHKTIVSSKGWKKKGEYQSRCKLFWRHFNKKETLHNWVHDTPLGPEKDSFVHVNASQKKNIIASI